MKSKRITLAWGLLSAMLNPSAYGVTNAEQAPDEPTPDAYFWIGETGPTGPLFSGPQQYPFICYTYESGLGQPLVDNHDGIGNAVFPETGGGPDFDAEPIGYSQYCNIPTQVDYVYYSRTAEDFLPLPDPSQIPDDVDTITVKGKTLAFIVRLERGALNRFIYSIAMPAAFPESLDSPVDLDKSAWNGRLVYKFQGGVGIGHWQGKFKPSKGHALHYESLKRGYAVAYSTGTRTGTHYNLRLAEETALMVKQHFTAVYGKPHYTIGIGGSGGAIQQYVIGQNNPYLIDGAIPQLSYPDMITQTIHIADCELLERYFDQAFIAGLKAHGSRWDDWRQRRLIEGLNAHNQADKAPWNRSPYAPKPGSSECINGWRGLVPKVFNPHWTHPDYLRGLKQYRYPPEVIAAMRWSHWNDLGSIYPQSAEGIARNTWDNIGVQYGLRALIRGDLTPQEFLDLNACIGGWKPPEKMVLGNYPWNPDAFVLSFDPWDQANMNVSARCRQEQPAPRTEGDIGTMHAAYQSGHVFTGRVAIPIIDIRLYLEPVLNMHHSLASFSARARIIHAQGHADNQLIWIAECSDPNPKTLKHRCAYDPTGAALDLMTRWLDRIMADPDKGVVANKPHDALDRCLDAEGEVLHAGPQVWNGILDDGAQGPCSKRFPVYSTSRREAGGDIRGDVFKCALKPVDTAVNDGTYGTAVFTAAEVRRLKTIFPTGVCDYGKPDVGKP